MDEAFKYVGNELSLFKKAHTWKKYFTNHINKQITGDVLEVGSGIGANTLFLINSARKAKSWTLLEPDKNLYNKAKKELTGNSFKTSIDINHINGTIKSVHNSKYDTILYIDVIEHIEGAQNELKNAALMLKEDGKLIVLVPAYQFLFNNFDTSVGHFRRYNKKLLKEHASGNVKINSLFYLDSMGFFASLLNKWVLKKDIPSQQNIYLWDRILVPISRCTDVICFYSFGKSLIGIFSNVNK